MRTCSGDLCILESSFIIHDKLFKILTPLLHRRKGESYDKFWLKFFKHHLLQSKYKKYFALKYTVKV